jgi:hypothetical protein
VTRLAFVVGEVVFMHAVVSNTLYVQNHGQAACGGMQCSMTVALMSEKCCTASVRRVGLLRIFNLFVAMWTTR